MEYKLDVKIMGVKKRVPFIMDILKQIGLGADCVVIDDRGYSGGGDAWYNAKRAWLAPIPEGVTHRMVLQDDILACNNFVEICEKLINVFPDVIWALNGGTWILPSMRKNDSPYIHVRGGGLSGQAVIIPVQHIQNMISWSDSVFGEDYKHDDGRIGFYALCNGVKVFGTIPSLVDHIQIDSVIPHHNSKKRICKTWVGNDIGYQNWDNTDYNSSPFMTNDIWINKNKEKDRYDRIEAIVADAKRRFFDAETEERKRRVDKTL